MAVEFFSDMHTLLIESDTCSDFFKILFEYKKQSFPKLTIRNFSKKYGFENPSLVSDILNKKKKVSKKLYDQLLSIEKFSYSQERYLGNLYKLENSRDENIVEKARSENKIIQTYWSVDKTRNDSVSAIALLLNTAIDRFQGSLLKTDIYDCLSFFITTKEIDSALDELEKHKFVEIKKDRYHIVRGNLVLLKSSPLDLIKIHKVIDRVTQFPNKVNSVSCMTLYINKEEYKNMIKEIGATHEKIALLAQKAYEDKDVTKDRKLCLIYTFVGSLETDDSWLS